MLPSLHLRHGLQLISYVKFSRVYYVELDTPVQSCHKYQWHQKFVNRLKFWRVFNDPGFTARCCSENFEILNLSPGEDRSLAKLLMGSIEGHYFSSKSKNANFLPHSPVSKYHLVKYVQNDGLRFQPFCGFWQMEQFINKVIAIRVFSMIA